ncbi:ABC transporter substrate-binding protein [Corynebacterium pseudodiphtheriticum]|uniref:ABC transporter substrate-binding protein n=1 Tax=Corynebacterium pseudodiphtheriticum TaxID=37637 RepID=UPI00266F7764|nr:ABC transporter substrate-binding protein [Corynebacterium pseudodiphtheriticum]WKS30777.1 ABC transporter substrate-binding protein [Corynebacterium pseudodiphtheriticum]
MKKIVPLCVAAALTLSACSSADEAADSVKDAASEAASTASSVASDAEKTANKDGESRTVDTELGEVEVPADVKSVVVLTGSRDLDIALSLELPVTGYPKAPEAFDLDSPLAAEIKQADEDGAETLYTAGDEEVDIDAIKKANPDLIIGAVQDVTPIHDELKEIAPVLPIGDFSTATWQDDLMLVASATGTEKEGGSLIADYEKRVGKLSDKYAKVLADNKFAPISYDGEEFVINGTRLLSQMLQDLGAEPSKAFNEALEGVTGKYSVDEIGDELADVDALVALVNEKSVWQSLQSNAQFGKIPAVKNEAVVRSDEQTHEGAYYSAMHALDVIEELLEMLDADSK